eukprot:gnl/Dysnectes_brevis/4301_a5714_499.p1 GENE.gnl/Dysnectes_brevis/4301_a5714_499~~gnl/Dysnectes_brevis/4301_a5714_499.p1  ORF type:complete len:1316 (-),score=208.87 gnl/Dysnectes_brevis/4301_a5714_499:50-3997(-)
MSKPSADGTSIMDHIISKYRSMPFDSLAAELHELESAMKDSDFDLKLKIESNFSEYMKAISGVSILHTSIQKQTSSLTTITDSLNTALDQAKDLFEPAVQFKREYQAIEDIAKDVRCYSQVFNLISILASNQQETDNTRPGARERLFERARKASESLEFLEGLPPPPPFITAILNQAENPLKGLKRSVLMSVHHPTPARMSQAVGGMQLRRLSRPDPLSACRAFMENTAQMLETDTSRSYETRLGQITYPPLSGQMSTIWRTSTTVWDDRMRLIDSTVSLAASLPGELDAAAYLHHAEAVLLAWRVQEAQRKFEVGIGELLGRETATFGELASHSFGGSNVSASCCCDLWATGLLLAEREEDPPKVLEVRARRGQKPADLLYMESGLPDRVPAILTSLVGELCATVEHLTSGVVALGKHIGPPSIRVQSDVHQHRLAVFQHRSGIEGSQGGPQLSCVAFPVAKICSAVRQFFFIQPPSSHSTVDQHGMMGGDETPDSSNGGGGSQDLDLIPLQISRAAVTVLKVLGRCGETLLPVVPRQLALELEGFISSARFALSHAIAEEALRLTRSCSALYTTGPSIAPATVTVGLTPVQAGLRPTLPHALASRLPKELPAEPMPLPARRDASARAGLRGCAPSDVRRVFSERDSIGVVGPSLEVLCQVLEETAVVFREGSMVSLASTAAARSEDGQRKRYRMFAAAFVFGVFKSFGDGLRLATEQIAEESVTGSVDPPSHAQPLPPRPQPMRSAMAWPNADDLNLLREELPEDTDAGSLLSLLEVAMAPPISIAIKEIETGAKSAGCGTHMPTSGACECSGSVSGVGAKKASHMGPFRRLLQVLVDAETARRLAMPLLLGRHAQSFGIEVDMTRSRMLEQAAMRIKPPYSLDASYAAGAQGPLHGAVSMLQPVSVTSQPVTPVQITRKEVREDRSSSSAAGGGASSRSSSKINSPKRRRRRRGGQAASPQIDFFSLVQSSLGTLTLPRGASSSTRSLPNGSQSTSKVNRSLSRSGVSGHHISGSKHHSGVHQQQQPMVSYTLMPSECHTVPPLATIFTVPLTDNKKTQAMATSARHLLALVASDAADKLAGCSARDLTRLVRVSLMKEGINFRSHPKATIEEVFNTIRSVMKQQHEMAEASIADERSDSAIAADPSTKRTDLGAQGELSFPISTPTLILRSAHQLLLLMRDLTNGPIEFRRDLLARQAASILSEFTSVVRTRIIPSVWGYVLLLVWLGALRVMLGPCLRGINVGSIGFDAAEGVLQGCTTVDLPTMVCVWADNEWTYVSSSVFSELLDHSLLESVVAQVLQPASSFLRSLR